MMIRRRQFHASSTPERHARFATEEIQDRKSRLDSGKTNTHHMASSLLLLAYDNVR